MFFVVPVTFSNMFILNINVFFGIYSFDLIRILLNKLCKYMLFHYFLFLFVLFSGVSSICSEKNCIAFLVNLLTKSVFVYFKNLRFAVFDIK